MLTTKGSPGSRDFDSVGLWVGPRHLHFNQHPGDSDIGAPDSDIGDPGSTLRKARSGLLKEGSGLCLRRDNCSLFLKCDKKAQNFIFFRAGLTPIYATNVMLSSTWTFGRRAGPWDLSIRGSLHSVSHGGQLLGFSFFPPFFIAIPITRHMVRF